MNPEAAKNTAAYGTPIAQGAYVPDNNDTSVALRVYSAFEAGVLEQALENFFEEVKGYDEKTVPAYMRDTFLETIASLQARFDGAKSRGRVLS